MGFRETAIEIARQLALGPGTDDWYYKQSPYVLELRSALDPRVAMAPGPGYSQALIAFPLGPEQYTVNRVFRQAITPTMGGLVAEERGILWREITVRGTFGLAVKPTLDTSIAPELPNPVTGILGLSGPAWTRRLMRNFFDKYADLKAKPEFAAKTQLIWHDLKTDDHWVVVPEAVEIDRTVEKRMQYPYMIRMKAIAKADNIILPLTIANVINAVGKAITAPARIANQAAKLISSAIQEGSRILGEIRFFVAGFDAILTNLNTIVTSAENFVNGLTDTLSVGRTFITSTATLLQNSLAVMEAADSLPDAVRQNYQQALDGLDALAAQPSFFAKSYNQEAERLARLEAGAAGDDRATLQSRSDAGPPESASQLAQQREKSTDLDLVDNQATPTGHTFGNYSGTREYAITNADTVESIAAAYLGDAARWFDIVLLNGLKPPYISETGAPGTVGVGDIIVLPTTDAPAASAVGASDDQNDLLGVDIELVDTELSAPGRPVVDIAIDEGTLTDVRTVGGITNLAQAIQMRMWTEAGSMPLLPTYGVRRAIGVNQTSGFLSLLQVNYREALIQDPRVAAITSFRFEVEEDTPDFIEISVDMVPIGESNTQTITVAV